MQGYARVSSARARVLQQHTYNTHTKNGNTYQKMCRIRELTETILKKKEKISCAPPCHQYMNCATLDVYRDESTTLLGKRKTCRTWHTIFFSEFRIASVFVYTCVMHCIYSFVLTEKTLEILHFTCTNSFCLARRFLQWINGMLKVRRTSSSSTTACNSKQILHH